MFKEDKEDEVDKAEEEYQSKLLKLYIEGSVAFNILVFGCGCVLGAMVNQAILGGS